MSKFHQQKLVKYCMRKLSVGLVSCALATTVFTGVQYFGQATVQASGVFSQTFINEIKTIQFTDETLTNTLGVRVGVSDGYVVKAITMAREEGKVWRDLTLEERTAYENRAKKVILQEKLAGDPYQEAFNRIKDDLNAYIAKYQIGAQFEQQIRANKHHFVMGLVYFETLYNINVLQNVTLKDKLFEKVNAQQLVNALIQVGQSHATQLAFPNNPIFYQNVLAPLFRSEPTLTQFIQANVMQPDQWFKHALKIVHYISDDLVGGVFQKFSQSHLAHVLPLLSLKRETIYMIATNASVTYGLYDTYVTKTAADKLTEEQALIEKVTEIGQAQKAHIAIWNELSNGVVPHQPTIVTDAFRIKHDLENPYATETLYTSRNSWATRYQTEGLKQFFAPFNLYAPYTHIGAVAEKPNIRLYMARALDERGLSAYTHELIHLYTRDYLLNHGQRSDTKVELLPRGLFESLEVDTPYFGLNLIYKQRQYTNTSYERFELGQVDAQMQAYMRNQMDLIYSLEILEAKELLSRPNHGTYFKQLSQQPGDTTQTVDTFNAYAGGNLADINALVDQNLVVNRYAFQKTTADSNQALNNGYHTIPLFHSFYAAPTNANGSVGDVTLRRLAFEILAQYGYKQGMASYLSDIYRTDNAAISGISSGTFSTLAAFKKAMYAERDAKLSRLNDVTFTYLNQQYTQADIPRLMSLAVTADLGNTRATTSQVDALKEAIFLAYKAQTNDFRSTIYKEEAQKMLYVRNGDLSSKDGLGTQDVPYDSLTHALSVAKPGDTIILVDNITYTHANDLEIDKSVTIEGNGNTIHFRGKDLSIMADVTLQNVNLAFLTDGNDDDGKIYMNDYHLTLNQVTTKVGTHIGQDAIRPILYAGGKSATQATGSGATLTILNATSDTRFKQIVVGHEVGEKTTPTTLNIAENTTVDRSVVQSSADASQNSGKVTINLASRQVKTFVNGHNATDVTINIAENTNIYNLDVDQVERLVIKNGSTIGLSDTTLYDIKLDQVVIENGATLSLNDRDHTVVDTIQIDGKLAIKPTQNRLTVTDTILGQGQIEYQIGNGHIADATHLGTDIIVTDQHQGATVPTTFTPNSGKYVGVKENSGYQIVPIQPTRIPLNVMIAPDGDYSIVGDYVGNELNVAFKDGNPESYISELLTLPELQTHVLLDRTQYQPYLFKYGATVTGIDYWVAQPGKLIIDNVETPYTITIENGKQVVSYTLEKPTNGYYTQNNVPLTDAQYGNKVVVSNGHENIVLTFVPYVTQTTETPIPFKTLYIADENLPFEQRDEQPGEKGVKRVTTQNGVIINETTTPAKDAIVRIGTKKVTTETVAFNTDRIYNKSILKTAGDVLKTPGKDGLNTITTRYEIDENGVLINPKSTVEETIKPITAVYEYGDALPMTLLESPIITKTTELPFKTLYIADETIPFEERIETPGTAGKKVVKTRDGEVLSEETTPAKDAVVRIGTKKITTETVAFKSDRIYNKSILKTAGDVLKTPGKDGLNTITTRYEIAENGVLINPKSTVEETVKPITAVYEYGNAIAMTMLEQPTVTTKQSVAFTTKYISDPQLPYGEQKELQKGVVGEKQMQSKDGKVLSEQQILAPQQQIIAIGTKKTIVTQLPIVTVRQADETRLVGSPEVVVDAGEAGEETTTEWYAVDEKTGQLTLKQREVSQTRAGRPKVVAFGAKVDTAIVTEKGMPATHQKPEMRFVVTEKAVPFERIEKEDGTLILGQRVIVVNGVIGKTKTTTFTPYLDNQVVGESTVIEEVVQPVIDEIILVGTKVADESSSQTESTPLETTSLIETATLSTTVTESESTSETSKVEMIESRETTQLSSKEKETQISKKQALSKQLPKTGAEMPSVLAGALLVFNGVALTLFRKKDDSK